MLALWWFWFAPEDRRRRSREIILATLVAAFTAIFLGRFLAAVLPFRSRPAFNPDLSFTAVPGAAVSLRGWSAFPSDHAMLFSALATGLFFISRPFGAAAYAYGFVFIDLPRIYVGFHHPTDVLGGMALGTALACAFNAERVRRPLSARLLEFMRAREDLFYAVFFLVSIEIMTMFDEPRTIIGALVHLFHKGGGQG